jgi:hypothetical protein
VLYSRRAALTGIVLVAGVLVAMDVRADDFVVVISTKNPESRLQRTDVRDAFIGQTKQWPNGAVVQPIIGEESSAEFAWLAIRIFRLSPREVLARIKQEIFRGEMKRPIVARDAQECFAAILHHEGGIGVVSRDAAANLPAGISTVAVDE